MPRLTPAKTKQLEGFFNDPKKALRLYNALCQKSDKDKEVILGRDKEGFLRVFRANVGKKQRAVKIALDQNVARWVSDLIRKEHALAVKQGKIVPRNYSLKVIRFLGQGKHGSAMPIIKSISCADLENHFLNKSTVPKVSAFLKKHPWVTSDLLDAAHRELRDNLWKLVLRERIPAFDVVKRSNIFILGANDVEKKLIFGLIDQAHPFLMDKLIQKYYSAKR
jgi:hypothetical protein